MNSEHHFCASVNRFILLALPFVLSAAVLSFAAAQSAVPDKPGKIFASPQEAVSALSKAVNSRDTNALADIFGPALNDMRSPDPVQRENELSTFTANLNASNHISRPEPDRCILETGEDRWPFPIPIVHKNGGWYFDTAAGKQEIVNRRIGNNELQALKSLRACAEAQREYASADRDGSEVLKYAQKFASSPGKKDGLYWPPDLDGEISPLGPVFVAGQSEGYFKKSGSGNPPQPFHGYFYKILTGQGKHAPGGKYNYIINGNMIGGFAVVAWPAKYGESGIMTFIINQQGRVYQKDLGPGTEAAVQKMKEYDPDPSWTQSPD